MKQENILDIIIEINDKKQIKIKEAIPEIIKGNTEVMIIAARKIGYYVGHELPKKERLYPYQFRRIFGTIRKLQIEEFNPKKLLLLKPQIVFTAVKNESTMGIQYLKDILIESINHIGENENYFYNFSDFFESILAYYQAADKESNG